MKKTGRATLLVLAGLLVYGSDGGIAALGLQTFSDPKNVQPVYAPAPGR